MQFTLRAKLVRKFDTASISATFKKREFVVEYAENPSYPQNIKMEFTQDRCEILDRFNLGDIVEVNFNIKGRIWINPQGVETFFNTIDAWRMTKVDENTPVNPVNPPVTKTTAENNSTSSVVFPESDNDDLPF